MVLFSRIRIVGHSMVPSLLPGDEILVSSLPYFFWRPKPKDVVLFTSPVSNVRMVKRIARVQNGEYFLIGDNSKDSLDSNDFGMVERNAIKGKMIIKL